MTGLGLLCMKTKVAGVPVTLKSQPLGTPELPGEAELICGDTVLLPASMLPGVVVVGSATMVPLTLTPYWLAAFGYT